MQVFLQTFIGGVSLGAIYALVALGFSLVFRTMGLVNFSHGNVVMIGAYIASTFYLTAKLPFALAMVVALAVTGLIGVFIELVLRPLENKDFDLMLIGTIGFGIVLEALAIIIWGATGRAVPNPVSPRNRSRATYATSGTNGRITSPGGATRNRHSVPTSPRPIAQPCNADQIDPCKMA